LFKLPPGVEGRDIEEEVEQPDPGVETVEEEAEELLDQPLLGETDEDGP
jgi:hypothetical protein